MVPSLVAGGFFLQATQSEILINETCARQLGFKNPADAIGHMAVTNYPEVSGPIVGIVADFHAQSLFSPITPTYLYGTKNLWRGGVQVKLTMQNKSAAQLKTTLAAIEKSWKE